MRLSTKHKVPSSHSRTTDYCRLTTSLDFHPQLFFQIILTNDRRLFRRACFVGHAVEFDHGPAAELDRLERCKYTRQIHLPATQLDEPVGARGVASRAGNGALYVLDVQE